MGRKKQRINHRKAGYFPKSKGDSAGRLTGSLEGMGEGLLLLVMVLVGALIYLNTLDNPFAFDDIRNIEDNVSIRLSSLTLENIKNVFSSKRPVAMLSFALNYYLHKDNVIGYHLINMLIHIVTGIMLYFFFKMTLIVSTRHLQPETYNPPVPTINSATRFSNYSFIAFFAAFIWLVHPIQTQSVAYIVQRMTSMSAMFYLFSLQTLLKFHEKFLNRLKKLNLIQG